MGHSRARCLRRVQAPHGRWELGSEGPWAPTPTPTLTRLLLCLQHNLCCDNCHSHVALALNLMRYNNSTNWNMVTLCFFCLIYGKYVSVGAFVKTWLPFVLLLGIILTISLVFNLR